MQSIDVSTREARAKFYDSVAWQRLRKQRLELDCYECQWCKQDGKVTTNADATLEIDHIKELEHYPELALDIENTRTLCKDCHNKRHERFNHRPSKHEKKWNDEWW